ncbi:MAG: hypothetical protein ACXV8U_15400 [Methylobacter sp.]
MPAVLQRITTEYIDSEDRIRLSGEDQNQALVVIWLTQRLLQRLLPKLIQALEGQPVDAHHAEIMQTFAQQAAQAVLTPQQPIQPKVDSSSWLAVSVDLAWSEQRIHLAFRGVEGQSAALMLEPTPLRQWLSILHGAYIQAEWEAKLWPAWLQENMQAASQEVVRH